MTSRKAKRKLAQDAARSIVRHGCVMEIVTALNDHLTPEKFAKLADAFLRERDLHEADDPHS
jgi:hypothetical protein